MNDISSVAPWRRLRTSLGYRIAIFTFWYWRFDALAYDRHFTELQVDEGLSALPDDNSQCYIFPSYPISKTPAALRIDGDRLIYTPKTFPNYFVDLTLAGGFEQYLQGFSSKTRSTLKRKVRRFAEASPDGKLDWRVYRSPQEIGEFLTIATALSELTYQARLLDCGLPTEPEFREQALELARQGLAYGFMLFVGDRAAAYVFSQRHQGVVSYDYVGHDPEFNALSPGTVLQYQLLEYLFADPQAKVFDFTEGEGAHKALFSTGRRVCAKSLVFPRRFGTGLLVRSHLLLGKLNDLIDSLVDRLALRQKIRRLIRRGAASAENT
ncbi:MAG TPA: GNAT family N-acetyltransferase [Burkholderiaceae bacterium]|nr:GNAT family N-acetyltransferase [Burkholderiaceae bacterium]